MSSNKKKVEGKKRRRNTFGSEMVEITPEQLGITVVDRATPGISTLRDPIPFFRNLSSYTPRTHTLVFPTFSDVATPQLRNVETTMTRQAMDEIEKHLLPEVIPEEIKTAPESVEKFVAATFSDAALEKPLSKRVATVLNKYFNSKKIPKQAVLRFDEELEKVEDELRQEKRQAKPNNRRIEILKAKKKELENMKAIASKEKRLYDAMIWRKRMKPDEPDGEQTRRTLFTEIIHPKSDERIVLRQALNDYETTLEKESFYDDLVTTLLNILPMKLGLDIFLLKNTDVSNGLIFKYPTAKVKTPATETSPGEMVADAEIQPIWRQLLKMYEATAIDVGASILLLLPVIKIFNFFTANSSFTPRNNFYIHDFNSELLTPEILTNNNVIISFATFNADKIDVIQRLNGTHTIALVWVKDSFLPYISPHPIPSGKRIQVVDANGWWCIIFDSSGWVDPTLFQHILQSATISGNEFMRSLYVADKDVSATAHANYLLFKDQSINGFITREDYGQLQERYNVCVYYSLYVAWHFITSPPNTPIDIDLNVNPDEIAHLFAPFVFRLIRQYRDVVPGIVSFPFEYEGNGIFSSKK